MRNLYGLLGQSLSHSISPIIHKAVFDILGVSAQYSLFEVEKSKLEDTLNGLKALEAIGVNVTIPYKTEIMQYLDTISPEAAAIGSINTIAFNGRTAVGYNTDYFGFGTLLDRFSIETDGREAMVLGYGGAAKAVVRFLLDHGIKSIIVAVRNSKRSPLIVGPTEFDKVTSVEYHQLPLQKAGDLIINCTPCGMYPHIHETPVSIDVLTKYHTAIDLIYNPQETLFLRCSAQAGLKAVNGLYMLVSQAVTAQEIWNNIRLSREDIESIYNMVVEYMLEKKV